MVRVTNDARRRIARVLRSYKAEDFAFNDPPCELAISLGIGCIGMDTCHGSDETPECVVRSFTRLADLIDPGPRAEEIAAKAYRAAADYIDWNIPDSEDRVRKLREQAEELEAMAREREPYDSDTTAGDTTKCDREALLAIANEMLSVSIGINSADSIRPLEAAYVVQGYARRIREACGAKAEP